MHEIHVSVVSAEEASYGTAEFWAGGQQRPADPSARGVLTADVSIQRGVEDDEDPGPCQEAQP